eukprot:GEMP01037258.1.p1 GENE.GEMP01037258.1~~GEMP01037258.1.p1  ORF type:complete len:494 (+),score=115.72 GEMP01037258.1:39-1520(+)
MIKWTLFLGLVSSLNERLATLQNLREAVVGKGVVGVSTRARSQVENTALHKFSYDRRHENKDKLDVLKLHAQIPHQNATLIESMPLKASAKQPGAMLCLIDRSFLVVYTGSQRLLNHDLGHEVVSWGVSTSTDKHTLAMVDPKGGVHVYDIRVRVDKGKKVSPLSIFIVETLTLSAPVDTDAEACASSENPDVGDGTCASPSPNAPLSAPSPNTPLTASPLIVERKGKQYILLGDAHGRITFLEDGVRVGSLRVANENEPIIGLVRNAEVPFAPCRGWADGAAVGVDVRENRLVVSLDNGDMLVFATARGKVRTCELLGKYPRLGPATETMKRLRGHYLRLAGGHLSIIHIVYSEQGTGKALRLIVPNFAKEITLLEDRLVAVTAGGLDIYDVNTQSAPESFDTSWFQFDNFPRIGVFGVILVLAVVWNVKKVNERRKNEDNAIKDEISSVIPENFKGLEERINAMQKNVDQFQDQFGSMDGIPEDDPQEERG